MKLLNLDEIIPTQRFVTIKGREYEIKNQSLQDLLSIVKNSSKKSPRNEIEAVQQTIERAKQLIPDCPDEVLFSLTPRQLKALIEFASAPDEEILGDDTEGKTEASA